MTTLISLSFFEGQSNCRPPLFNGSNYMFWKACMKIFIQALYYDMWGVITNRPHTPTSFINRVSSSKVTKDWDENDKNMAQLDAKVINVVYCPLYVSKFNRISTCTSIKKIWDRLKITHEETCQVKESKINLLVHKYELFKIEQLESIFDIFFRFTDIINTFNSLGKTCTNNEVVFKVLRCLLKVWKVKVIATQEVKYLSKLSIKEFIDSLMTHELNMFQKNKEKELEKKKSIAFKSTTKSKKSDELEDEDEKKEKMEVRTWGYLLANSKSSM